MATLDVPIHLTAPRTEGCHLHGRVFVEGVPPVYVVECEPAVSEFVKRVFPGCVARRGRITFPVARRTTEDLNWLLTRWPMQLDCGEVLDEQRGLAIEHAARREGQLELEPVSEPPGFHGRLLPFQREGVAFLAANERSLLADDMGLGKTVTALAAVAHTGAFPVLVVCPPSVVRQWQRQAQAFLRMRAEGECVELPPAVQVLTGRGPKAGKPVPEAPITIVHYLVLSGWRDWIRERGFGAVVFDEAQELRRPGSDKYAAASLISSGVRYVWALSGTPIYNYGEEIWAVMNAVDFVCLGGRDAFIREWCREYRGKYVINEPAVLGQYMRREGLMLRRRKDDVQADLPPKRRVVTVVGHDEDVYGRLVANAVAIARGYDGLKEWRERGEAARRIEEETRKATGTAKAPYVGDFVRGLVAAGERVLVFAYHHDVYDALMLALHGLRVVCMTGRESQAEKDGAVTAFGAGEADVALLSLRTSAGLDGLQRAGTCVVFAELDWSPAIHSQCEDRLHRQGLTSGESILCYYLVAETGSDEAIQEVLGLKIDQFAGLMGDEVTGESAEAREDATQRITRVIERLRRSA